MALPQQMDTFVGIGGVQRGLEEKQKNEMPGCFFLRRKMNGFSYIWDAYHEWFQPSILAINFCCSCFNHTFSDFIV